MIHKKRQAPHYSFSDDEWQFLENTENEIFTIIEDTSTGLKSHIIRALYRKETKKLQLNDDCLKWDQLLHISKS